LLNESEKLKYQRCRDEAYVNSVFHQSTMESAISNTNLALSLIQTCIANMETSPSLCMKDKKAYGHINELQGKANKYLKGGDTKIRLQQKLLARRDEKLKNNQR